MKHKLFSSIVVVGFLAVAVVAAPTKFRYAAKPIPHSYLIVLHKNLPEKEIPGAAKRLAHAHGGAVTAVITNGIHLFGFRGSEQAALALSRNPEVAWVEQDGYVDTASTASCGRQGSTWVCQYQPVTPGVITPCDASLHNNWACDDDHWNLDRADNNGPINSNDRSYGFTTTGAGVRAYIVDSGVYGWHSELIYKVEPGASMTVDDDMADDNPLVTNCSFNPADYNNPGSCEQVIPKDYYPANNPCFVFEGSSGHGTAVASVLAGYNVGIAPNAGITPVKVETCDGTISLLAVARGLSWILQDLTARPSPAVVNISLRFLLGYPDNNQNPVCETTFRGSDYTNCMMAIENQVVAIIQRGVPVVVAAGNDLNDADLLGVARLGHGGSYGDPAWRTITVGGTMYSITGTTYSDQLWTCNAARDGDPVYPYCTRNMGSNYGRAVSIYAPAWNVKVAEITGGYRSPGIASSGTSFAAPLVAGAIARLLERYPSWTESQIWQKIHDDAVAHSAGNPDFDPTDYVNRLLLYMDRSQ